MADDEELCRNHIIGDGGEDELKSSQVQREKTQKLDEKSDGAEEELEDSDGAEEEVKEEDGEDDVLTSEYDSDDSGYFIIDHARFPNRFKDAYLPIDMDAAEVEEAEVDVDKWNKYYQETRESGGFDIHHYPGDCVMATYRPLNVNTASQSLLDFCASAINEFNPKEGAHYSFEKLEKANARLWDCGANYYLTFRAKESVAGASKTFQALVWRGTGGPGSMSTVVKFCRLREQLLRLDLYMLLS